MKTPLTVGSLFSGIGGIDLGLERVGMKVLWQVEKDEYARQVLKKHWPNINCYEDVQDIHGWDGDHHPCGECLIPVDVLCGGFPCQDISVAGKGAGITGQRSGLWKEFARLIQEIKPSWVLIENVPALRSRGMETVLQDLSACGYDAEWDGISAAAVGAPHLRDRLFIVAYPQRKQLRDEPGGCSGAQGQNPSQSPDHGSPRDVADVDSNGRSRRGKVRERKPNSSGSGEALGHKHDSSSQGILRLATEVIQATNANINSERELQPQGRVFKVGRRISHSSWWATEPGLVRMAHGVPHRMDRIRCLGNAVVPQVAEAVGRLIVEAHASARG